MRYPSVQQRNPEWHDHWSRFQDDEEFLFKGWIRPRRLSFSRNALNVFDKLNAPQTHFISRERIEGWFSPEEFDDVRISSYRGVSWRGSGRVR